MYITKFPPHQPVVHNPVMDGARRRHVFVAITRKDGFRPGDELRPAAFIVQEKPQKEDGDYCGSS
jgi:hypothetical protein